MATEDQKPKRTIVQPQVKRTLIQADANDWLMAQSVLVGCSIITSMPDISEFQGQAISDWQDWFSKMTELVLSRCPDDGVAIFFQTDIKHEGVWVDKGFLCQKVAEKMGHALLAHKIVCRVPAGTVTFGRPAYSHLLCFSKKIRPELTVSFSDVLPEAGESTWARGMGLKACELACRMVKAYTPSHTIVDPFCGHGLVLAVANTMGLNALGVDRSSKCVKKAQALRI